MNKSIAILSLMLLTGCDPEVAVQVDPIENRDGSPFDPGCAYISLVQGPAGCVQELALCLDALIPVPCTAGSPACYDGYFACVEAGTECMKTNQP